MLSKAKTNECRVGLQITCAEYRRINKNRNQIGGCVEFHARWKSLVGRQFMTRCAFFRKVFNIENNQVWGKGGEKEREGVGGRENIEKYEKTKKAAHSHIKRKRINVWSHFSVISVLARCFRSSVRQNEKCEQLERIRNSFPTHAHTHRQTDARTDMAVYSFGMCKRGHNECGKWVNEEIQEMTDSEKNAAFDHKEATHRRRQCWTLCLNAKKWPRQPSLFSSSERRKRCFN